MRAVSGLERPIVQWLFVALAVVLIAVAAAEAIGLRRARAEIESLRATRLDARVQQEELQNRLAHEQATREALTLELARVRGSTGSAPGDGRGGPTATQPTLTLTPLTTRGAEPPEPTVTQPPTAQSIQLRLVLPRGRASSPARYNISVRTWSGGETVWQRSGLAGAIIEGQAMVTTFVTGDVFSAGAYEVLLTSIAEKPVEVASYEVAVR